MRSKLRVGLVVESLQLPAWVRRSIAEIAASEVAEIALVAMSGEERPRPSGGSLWRMFDRFEGSYYRLAADAFQMGSAAALDGVPAIPLAGGIDEIRARRLDVVIVFADAAVEGLPADIARNGAWTHDFGVRGGPVGFHDVASGSAVSSCALRAVGGKEILAESWIATDRHSVRRNRNAVAWRAAGLAARGLRALDRGGAARRVSEVRPMEGYPSDATMAAFLARLGARYLKDKLEHWLNVAQWRLLIRTDEEELTPEPRLERMIEIRPPRDVFWADPFPVKNGNGWHIFVEEYPYATAKGRLAVVDVDSAGKLSGVRTILERPYHLSYPNVFSWGGERFMIPETRQAGNVQLYRAVSFPYEWALDTVLLEGVAAVDATVLEHEGRWWMFVNLKPESTSANDELHVYHADAPRGPWQKHPMNPVKSDVRSARPAGRIFSKNGVLYRPGQDCSESYGYGITVNRILQLTPEEYEEAPVSHIRPWRRDVAGVHTMNACEGLTVYDARFVVSRFGSFFGSRS